MTIEVSRATAEALELPQLLELVAYLTATDLGRERARSQWPLGDEELLRRRRRAFGEAERLVAARPLVPAPERPVGPLLEALDGGRRELDGRSLVALGDFLRTGSEAVERIRDADPPCLELAARVAEVPSCDELLRRIDRTFDRRGQIREDASPRLSELRSRIRGARGRVYEQLSAVVEAGREHFSEETIPLRGGRLVLMLQAGARGRLPGLVHGRSGSGKSFYFEPLDTVELNNQLQQAVEDEEAEKRRLLAEIIALLREQRPVLGQHADLVAELDLLQASARFARHSGGRTADLADRHDLQLRGARHPLLDPGLAELRREALGQSGHGDAVVPLDLELTAEHRALVVTGPNAGGKTVALKTLGLLALAHQCGLPLPVDAGSRLPFFAAIVATVGDEQDLLADRSTFSGRLLRLREAWDAAGPDSLVLLDELGSGTDPEEGAALAIALVEGMVERRALCLVTTHLSPLAAAALETEGTRCAAMQLDPETGGPTYRLLPGPPGGSEALALARRLGLPASWLDRAEELLGSEHRDLRRLLEEVERSRRETEATRRSLAAELADVESLRRRLAEQEVALATERKTVARALKQEFRAFREGAARRLREEVERARRKAADGHLKGVVREAVERIVAGAPPVEELAEEAAVETEVVVGGTVRHRVLGWEGILEKLDRGRAQVRVRGKFFRCREDELAGIVPAAPAKPGSRRVVEPARRRVPGPSLDDPGVSTELNLIGQRVEPALDALDRFLDQALLASHDTVRIVHGHGSGRLRAAVRDHLRAHPAARRHRPAPRDEGGDGATLVDLRT